jgi:hypothetical protein
MVPDEDHPLPDFLQCNPRGHRHLHRYHGAQKDAGGAGRSGVCEGIVDRVLEPLVALDANLRIKSVNNPFLKCSRLFLKRKKGADLRDRTRSI